MKNNDILLLLSIVLIQFVFIPQDAEGNNDFKETLNVIWKQAISQTRLLGSLKYSFITDIDGIGVDQATYYII
jgi:hypothetical protein